MPSMKKTREERIAELLERVAALKVAGSDPTPVLEEIRKVLAEKPPENTDGPKS